MPTTKNKKAPSKIRLNDLEKNYILNGRANSKSIFYNPWLSDCPNKSGNLPSS